jgi:hypothetical protein
VLSFWLRRTDVELVLLEHYEDAFQLVPLFCLAAGALAIAAHVVIGGAGTVWLVRATMGILIPVGVVGMILHYRGNLEFQLEMDATQSGWQLFFKAMHAKTPPALAPGVMAQLGLLGLLYTYRHPSLARREPSSLKEVK